MNYRIPTALAAGACALAALAAPSLATAAQPLDRVQVRTEGKDKTLAEGPLLTRGHDITADNNTRDGGEVVTRKCDATNAGANPVALPTPTASTADAMVLAGSQSIGADWYDGFEDFFVKRFGPDGEDASTNQYWGILVNGVYTSVGGCQYGMARDDVATWIYDAFNGRLPLRLDGPEGIGEATSASEHTPSVEPVKKVFTVGVGEAFEVHVKGLTDTYNPGYWNAVAGIGVSPVSTEANGYQTVLSSDPATVISDEDGAATLSWTAPGWKRIKADGEVNTLPTIRSNRLDVCVEASAGNGCGPLPWDAQIRGVTLPKFTEDTVALGSATVGGPAATKQLTFRNNDSEPIVIGDLTGSGPAAGELAFAADTCSDQTIAPGASCTAQLRLTATALGERRAYVSATLGDDLAATPSVLVTATGIATEPIESEVPVAPKPAPPITAPAPPGATVTAPAPAGKAIPVVRTLRLKAKTLSADGRLAVAVACPAGATPCHILLRVTASYRLNAGTKVRTRVVGSRTLKIQPGTTVVVRLKTPAAFRAYLAQRTGVKPAIAALPVGKQRGIPRRTEAAIQP